MIGEETARSFDQRRDR